MPRLRETEAIRILREENERLGLSAVSAFTCRVEQRLDASRLEWWLENLDEVESSETLRNLSYLRAYLRIAGEMPLSARGIQLDRKRLWMDRSVIKRLYRDGFLAFVDGKHPIFELTEKGKAFVDQQ